MREGARAQMSIAMPDGVPAAAAAPARGNAQGIWSNLGVLHGSRDPLRLLMQLARLHNGCIPVRSGSQRVLLLTEAEHFKHVLVTKCDSYSKYFDGLKPIFGKSMITMEGALWQKLRVIEQPAFHPSMIAGYVPYF